MFVFILLTLTEALCLDSALSVGICCYRLGLFTGTIPSLLTNVNHFARHIWKPETQGEQCQDSSSNPVFKYFQGVFFLFT